MGRVYDALRKAEQERRHGNLPVNSEPTVIADASELAAPEPAGVLPGAREIDAGARPTVQMPPPPRHAGGCAVRPSPDLVALADPWSPVAEHLRAIRSRILRMFEEHRYRSLLITSAGRGEGKSTTAANLALLLAAEINRRVLLVDSDLRKPAVDRLFALAQGPGLSDVARGRVRWPQAIVPAPWNGLAVLPAGARVDNATELLNGPTAREFFRDVRNAYDFVVVDAPPVLPVADAVVLASLVDAVLLVARCRTTPREALVEAVDVLEKAKLLGVVLNAVPDRPLVRRGYYSY